MRKKPSFTVFYAWQSDSPEKLNRKLIRDALENAIERINTDDEIPYLVELDHDTKNVPGLCDIPATILSKIEKADAFIADLTYVAKSDAKQPRHCSNPNVLFELGFAFRERGWERLILVMNEAFGPRTEQIFDLDHRRHPVTYKASERSTNLQRTTAKLSAQLEEAIRGVIKHGLHERTPQDNELFKSRLSQVESVFDQQAAKRELFPRGYWKFMFHPESYEKKRWTSVNELEELIGRNAVRRGPTTSYPPHTSGMTNMAWGIFNQYYRDLWGLSYDGIFVARQSLNCDSRPYPISNQIIGQDNPPEIIPAGEWVYFNSSIKVIYELLRLLILQRQLGVP